MTRLFHVLALLLLLAAIAFDVFVGAPEPVNLDPEAGLIGVVEAAGLRYDDRRRILGDGTEFVFSQAGCAAPIRIRLFPSIHRDAERARAWSREQGPKSFLVYRGEKIGDDAFVLTIHWAAVKAAILFRLARKSPWDSNLLAVAAPQDCATPTIDWLHLLQKD